MRWFRLDATTKMDREAIVAEARSWVDPPTPFHHQASVKGVGCDCIGLLAGVGRALQIEGAADFARAMLDEFAGYGMDPNPALLRRGCGQYLVPIARKDVRLGDVLLFTMPKAKGEPKHFGIVSRLDPMYMVHSWAGGAKRVVENRVDAMWERRILACYRFRGID